MTAGASQSQAVSPRGYAMHARARELQSFILMKKTIINRSNVSSDLVRLEVKREVIARLTSCQVVEVRGGSEDNFTRWWNCHSH
jgi:hypothetical protein